MRSQVAIQLRVPTLKNQLRWLQVLFVICLVSASPVNSADALKSFGAWAAFVETDPQPKVCWIATNVRRDPQTGQRYYLAVSKFLGRRGPEIAIYSEERMPKSSSIYLEIEGKRYRMRSDGTAAWLPASFDRKVISRMVDVSKASNPSQRVVVAGQGSGFRVSLRIDGFEPAWNFAKQQCARP